MLFRPTNPAEQLHSVAMRFTAPLSRAVFLRGSRSSHPAADIADPTCPIPSDVGQGDRLARIEAVLFLAREPLSSRKLSQYANLADGTEARTLVRRLNRSYDEQGRALHVEQVAGGYQMLTRPKFAVWLRRFEHVPTEMRLSAPAMETLAVVAYRQPTLRVEVEAIRGVSCGEILRQLLQRDLVRISGRSDELGAPYLYGTTKRFLRLFGLRNLDELPRADALRNPPVTGTIVGQESRQGTCEIDNHHEQENSNVSITFEETEQREDAVEDPKRAVPVSEDNARASDDDDVDEDDEDDEDDEYEYYDEEDESSDEEEEEDDDSDEELDPSEFDEEFDEDFEEEPDEDEVYGEDDLEDNEWEEVDDDDDEWEDVEDDEEEEDDDYEYQYEEEEDEEEE